MTKFLINRFTNKARLLHSQPVPINALERQKLGLLSGIIGIVLNFLLFGIKLFVALVSGSVAIMADAFNNLSDSISSIVTLLAFKLSIKPADKEHPFGHGRYEDVSALVVVAFIFFLGYEFMRFSIEAIMNPQEINYSWHFLALLFVALVIKFCIYVFNKKLGKKINSEVLLAVATDSINDCIITIATISTIIMAFFGFFIDGYIGIFVSLMIFRSGIKTTKNILSNILGKPAGKATAEAIKKIVCNLEGIISVHALVVHNYGANRSFATIHAEAPANISLGQAHNLADIAEKKVMQELGINLLIHLEPVDTKDECISFLRALCQDFLNTNYPQCFAHDFKLHNLPKLPIFKLDLEVPHSYNRKNITELTNNLKMHILQHNLKYTIKININYTFVE